jgi:hypothetical protein
MRSLERVSKLGVLEFSHDAAHHPPSIPGNRNTVRFASALVWASVVVCHKPLDYLGKKPMNLAAPVGAASMSGIRSKRRLRGVQLRMVISTVFDGSKLTEVSVSSNSSLAHRLGRRSSARTPR